MKSIKWMPADQPVLTDHPSSFHDAPDSNVWRVLLVGIGGYGQNYIHAALERERLGIIRLVGIVDPVARLSSAYNLVAHLPCYPDLESFYQEGQADLVIISSPIQYHAAQVCQALAHSSHVLCEKPLCATAEEARAMQVSYHASGKIAAIGFQWSFAPSVLRARQEILDGRWGAFRQLKCIVKWPRAFSYYQRNNWAGRIRTDQGSAVMDNILNNATAHYLHQILFFLGDRISAAALPDHVDAACFRAYPIETYDTAFVRMQFGQVPAFIVVSHATENPLNPHFEFILDKGTFYAEGDDQLMLRTPDGQVVDYGIMGANSVDDKLDTVIRAMSTGEQIPCDIDTASAHAAVIQAIAAHSVHAFAGEAIRKIVTDDGTSERLIVSGLEEVMDMCYKNLELPKPGMLNLC